MAKNQSKTVIIKQNSSSILLPVIISLLIGLAVGFFMARMKYKRELGVANMMYAQRDNQYNAMRARMNRVVMVDGKVFQIQNGGVSPVTDVVSLNDGAKVGTDGEVTRKDGSVAQLKDGDSIDMNGVISQGASSDQF